MANAFNPQGPALRNLTSAIGIVAEAYQTLRDYPGDPSSAPTDTLSVGELRQYISNGAAQLGDTITLPCMFYPALLLRRGWWQNQSHLKIPPLRDPIQRWLTHGMFEWAPSWEFPRAGADHVPEILPAQAGDEDSDEGDSIAVLIVGQRVVEDALRETHRQVDTFGRIAFWAKVTGRLMQIKDLASEPGLPAPALALDPSSYVILVHAADPRHGVGPDSRFDGDPAYPIYSGYLWKCVAPERNNFAAIDPDWDPVSQPLGVIDVYFVWEHTNLASPEAIVYNLVSINQKIEYLEEMYQMRFRLLEQSCRVVSRERPAARHHLQNLLAERLRVPSAKGSSP